MYLSSFYLLVSSNFLPEFLQDLAFNLCKASHNIFWQYHQVKLFSPSNHQQHHLIFFRFHGWLILLTQSRNTISRAFSPSHCLSISPLCHHCPPSTMLSLHEIWAMRGNQLHHVHWILLMNLNLLFHLNHIQADCCIFQSYSVELWSTLKNASLWWKLRSTSMQFLYKADSGSDRCFI